MVTVEIEYEDGVRATWETTDDHAYVIEKLIKAVIGPPDTIKC